MQYDVFAYPCLDQLITHVGRYHWRTKGGMEFPITIRMPYGGGVRAPEMHDDSPEAYYVHTPGIKVAIPSTPADAKGLLAAAIRDPDPVVILEPKLIYRAERADVPEGDYVVPLGKARLAREGNVVTMFPEGTRRTKGLMKKREARPRSGAARIALEAGVPLVPAAVRGTDRLLRLGKLRVAYGAPVDIDDLRGQELTEAAQEATARLMARIEELEASL